MRLPKFEYAEPKDIKEASSILSREAGAKVLAGGTDLLVNMKYKVERPSILVNIKKLDGLDYIRSDGGTIRIGALTPLKKIYNHPDVSQKAPALAQAASSVGSYHHQVMGTIGGNVCQQNRCKFFNQSLWARGSRALCYKAGGEICHVVNQKGVCFSAYSGDMAPALLALNASAVLAGSNGSRTLPVETLFSGDGKAPLSIEKGEILTEIVLPGEAFAGASIYKKIANRASIDFPIIGGAAWISADRESTRLAFTAVDRRPVRAYKLEKLILEKGLDQLQAVDASGLTSEDAKPVNTSVYSAGYKRKMIGHLALIMLGEMARG